MSKTGAIIKFDNDYIETCFYAWYQVRGLSKRNLVEYMPVAQDGRKPDKTTITSWRDKFGWVERADALDAQLSLKLDAEAIEKRRAIIERLAEDGKALKDAGIDYIKKEDPFKDNPSAAVRAIVAGSEMEFKYSGMADLLAGITTASNDQLTKMALRLLGKNENEENTIEAFSEDVPSGEDDDNKSEDDND